MCPRLVCLGNAQRVVVSSQTSYANRGTALLLLPKRLLCQRSPWRTWACDICQMCPVPTHSPFAHIPFAHMEPGASRIRGPRAARSSAVPAWKLACCKLVDISLSQMRVSVRRTVVHGLAGTGGEVVRPSTACCLPDTREIPMHLPRLTCCLYGDK